MDIDFQNLKEQAEKTLSPVDMDKEKLKKWRTRIKFALEYHKKELVPKYKTALKRYNSEMGFNLNTAQKARHNDVNFLYRAINDFIGSVFFRNPEIDLTARNEENQEERKNVEYLEQCVNDDVKDNRELKSVMRSLFVDESLAGIGAVYCDYELQTIDSDEPIEGEFDEQGQPLMKQIPLLNRVRVDKIRPENIIRPPYQQLFNWRSGPYLGYCDIISLDELRADQSLNQDVVAKLKGDEYTNLANKDTDLNIKTETQKSDDNNFVKVYYVFIRDFTTRQLYRLVMADEEQCEEPLDYRPWEKGSEKDGFGFPIHIFALNEPANGFIPPSEAWILERPLETMEYIFEKMDRHLRKSDTKIFVRGGVNGMTREELNKIVKKRDQEIIMLEKLTPEQPIGNVIKEVVTSALSGDHGDMYGLCKRVFDELSRRPSFSTASTINKDKTATETQAIQQTDATANGDYVDKIREFWIDLLTHWALLLQRNMQDERVLTVTRSNGETESIRADRDKLQGEFGASVDVNTFLPPNPELKRRTLEEAIQKVEILEPIANKSGYTMNGKKLITEWGENLEIRNSEDLIVPIPVRSIDQQISDFVFKEIPFNPEELGDKKMAFERLTEIFQDDEIMEAYELINQNTNVQVAQLLAFLADNLGIETAKTTGQPSEPSEAQTDMGANASVLGQAQNG